MPFQTRIGAVFHERYEIERIIGQGGYGFIYLAQDQRLAGRYCAVKQVSYDPTFPPAMLQEARDQFMREATVLARLDHPNLPKVSDFFSFEDNDFLVMDYVPGDDLRALLAKAENSDKFLQESEVLAWALQIGDAQTYLHSQDPPILHRDYQALEHQADSQRFSETGRFWFGEASCPWGSDHHHHAGAGHSPLYSLGAVWR